MSGFVSKSVSKSVPTEGDSAGTRALDKGSDAMGTIPPVHEVIDEPCEDDGIVATYNRTADRRHTVGEFSHPLDLNYAADFQRSEIRQAFIDAVYDVAPWLMDAVTRVCKRGGFLWLMSSDMELWLVQNGLHVPMLQLDIANSWMERQDGKPFRVRAWRTDSDDEPTKPDWWPASEEYRNRQPDGVVIKAECKWEVDINAETYAGAVARILSDVERGLRRELSRVYQEAEELGAIRLTRENLHRDMVRLALRHFFDLRSERIIDYEDGYDIEEAVPVIRSPYPRRDRPGKSRVSGVEKSIKQAAAVLGLTLRSRKPGAPRGPRGQ
jgi:hypothetical protein